MTRADYPLPAPPPPGPSLFDYLAQQPPASAPAAAPDFDGATYDPQYDQARLGKQLGRVYHVMREGTWCTLYEIQQAIAAVTHHHDSEAAISARLRDLRKKKHGSHTVDRRRRGDPRQGLWEYRLAK